MGYIKSCLHFPMIVTPEMVLHVVSRDAAYLARGTPILARNSRHLCGEVIKGEGGEGGEEGAPPDGPEREDGDEEESAESSVGSPRPAATAPQPDEELGAEHERADMHIATSPGCSPPPHPMIAADNTRPASLPASREDREERESPSRCPSRDSRASVGSARCPSRESDLPPGVDAIAAALPATLQAHSAVAALLGVAPHRLMSMAARGPISPHVSSSSSPPNHPLSSPPSSPNDQDGSVLDFSKKSSSKRERDVMDPDALNLSKPDTPEPDGGAPLDLSCSSRKRSHDDTPSPMLSPRPPSKSARVSNDFKNVVSPWTSPVVASHFPYFAAAVAAASGMSPKNSSPNAATAAAAAMMDPALWNGKLKGGPPSDATKALEKMSELSKLGSDEMFRPLMGGPGAGGATGRHSAWQSHWLNKGADTAKDVLKCVWCKQSFPSLAALTTHMKEAKHCGVNVPVPPIQPPPPPPPSGRERERERERERAQERERERDRERERERERERDYPPTTPSPNHSGKSPSDLNMLIKETMPLPRKLVRGQDVWLGKGAEQTRQILKCMWCGQSFRSLAEMTQHMQQTQHYTNIISQEQIISWKTNDGEKPPSQSAPSGSQGPAGGPSAPAPPNNAGASSHVSAVLTCKVCDQAFSSLKDLSNHMVKNQHYKEHIMRSITESGGRRRQTREKRKKSLPVRKLLELERAQNELKNGEAGLMGVKLPRDLGRDLGLTTKISCEKCGEKIETAVFVDHVRLCVGGGIISPDQRNLLKNALLSNSVLSPESPTHPGMRDARKSKDERPQLSPTSDTPSSPKDAPAKAEGAKSDSPSVLCAIEKLIEKSFDSRARHGAGFPGPGGAPGAAMGSSILKRLGIDETVDYTKPLVDPQTMNLLRTYHQQQQQMYHRRERSGSESSSMSERGGGSAGRPEALTPDRKSDQHTPRTTPDKRMSPPASKGDSEDEDHLPIKRERRDHDDDDHEDANERLRAPSNASVDGIKREKDDAEDEDRESVASRSHKTPERDADDHHSEGRRSVGAESRGRSSVGPPSPTHSPRHTPLPAASPASSERSTPRSSSDRKSSLGALSSMFDSLSGGGSAEGGAAGGKASSHPLAALQKLCDKTETHRHARANNNNNNNNSASGGGAAAASAAAAPPATTPGAILAFSWACNDAIMTENSVMKCAFCDTPFISKGAYRHHLSKMHFVKDGAIPDPVAIKAHQAAQAAAAAAQPPTPGASSSGSSKTSNGSSANPGANSPGKSPQAPPAFEESPHSKFLKYTELAKQLSSKYV